MARSYCIGLKYQPTPPAVRRLKCGEMKNLRQLRPISTAIFAAFLLSGPVLLAQKQTPLPLKPAAPGVGSNHRIILKDGTYQVVRKYEIVGDRVRYQSVERGDVWEELPLSLVDWEATRKWERDHVTPAVEDVSPAMRDAEEIDKEEAAERDDQKARMPEVAKGLELPDEDSVFILDTYQGTPELVELLPNNLAIDAKTHHGLATLNPLAGSRSSIELPGAHAKAHLHVNDPVIYVSLEVSNNAEQVLTRATTVDTSGVKEASNRKHGAHSAQSGFALVKVDERKAMRIIGAIHVSPTGNVTQDENVIPAKVEILPGRHWLKVTPTQPLLIGGEYALVEIISPSEINQTVWDFRVDPRTGDNEGSIGPILKQ